MISDNEKFNMQVKPNSAFLNELKSKLPEFFDREGDFDLDKFKRQLKKHNINELSDGYQLNFIGKDYARRQAGEMSSTVIVPDEEQNNGEGKTSKNLFLTGDNLEVLRHLQNNYAGKIDVIYIDPPYNTGNDDFVYPDTFEYSDEKIKEMFGIDDEQVERLKSIQGKSSHSAWLTFMYPRLVLAKMLLTKSGCIMVSIDENEDYNLKALLNETYGDNNFIGQIVRKTRSSANDTINGFNQQHEFLYVYAKNTDAFKMVGDLKNFDEYNNPDNDPNGDWKISDPSARSGSEGTSFEIINPHTGKKDLPPKGRYWAFSKNTMDEWINSGKFVFKKNHKDGERGFFIKKYVKELKSRNKQVDSLFGIDNKYMNQVATKYLRDEIFNGLDMFSSPKPNEFIKKILMYTGKKDALVLDFFAGSSTTADAVMQLNAEDGGNRKFIMVQLPEKTYTVNSDGKEVPTKGGKAAYEAGFKSIDEISRERIRRAAAKIKADNDLTLPKDFDGSFKHYRVVNPTKQTLEDIEDFDPDNTTLFTDMVDSFSSKGLDVAGDATGEQTILTTWLSKDGYPFNADIKKIDFAGYEASLVEDSRLYIINNGWSNKNTEALLNKIGTHQITVQTIVLFGYSFNIADLRELEIGLKQLDGNINLLKRY
ncbi:site-specific DNA-methyltransferase [Ligilactobacillus salivarius]|uniref:site-specific DNA-methyltransferase n=1 Tax=Ligilactobacillus salivarius TaxID=1624 RepID=UPI0011CA13A6|nr:site-specific DNA-methyltransferase [Ligilactobacillus salivarius]MBX0284394.1 site-specific DNA-methyltransferase [Ligilactobacillus salivarius]TXJ79921.1 site-specific DNA-methyltransferase [Ligilactobacillus salivarius]